MESTKYYAFWRDIYNHGQDHPQIHKKIMQAAEKVLNLPYEPEGHSYSQTELSQRRNFLNDLKEELLYKLVKNKLSSFEDKKSINILETAKDLSLKLIVSVLQNNPQPAHSNLFIKALGHEGDDVREKAATALASIGNRAQGAVPALLKMNGDEYNNVRESTKLAIQNITGKSLHEFVPDFIKMLDDEDNGVRKNAVVSLAMLGEKSHEAIPAIIKTLGDKNKQVRAYAALALGYINMEVHKTVPALIKALSDKDKSVRAYAVTALGLLGEKAHEAMPDLTKVLNDENEKVRHAAQNAINEIKGGIKANE